MTIGEKIKIIREYRKMTQKGLGLRLGYPANSAAVRVAQYESNSRVPKEITIKKIAEIINCSPLALQNGEGMGYSEEAIENLFWLEYSFGTFNLFKLTEDKNETNTANGYYNNNEFSSSPIAIIMDSGSLTLHQYMCEWAIRNEEYRTGKITKDEYFEWKISWPYSCDDCGNFETKVKWRKSDQENINSTQNAPKGQKNIPET